MSFKKGNKNCIFSQIRFQNVQFICTGLKGYGGCLKDCPGIGLVTPDLERSPQIEVTQVVSFSSKNLQNIPTQKVKAPNIEHFMQGVWVLCHSL